jgi:ABC-2 type transport system ATP-binding protein
LGVFLIAKASAAGDDRRMTPYAVETSGLVKHFGTRVAVDSVDLRVPRGSAFGYLGPNGAGKTTLIRMLLGLTRAGGGTMRLLGRTIPNERAAALARVGAVVEEPRFHRYLTGRENLDLVAAAREPDAHARIGGALARVGLAERADDRVSTYSLGMRQRLGVARALLGDPELLILDEPTNGLDPAGIHEFRGLIRGLVGEGRTVLLSSHLLDEVEKICDTVAIVDHGRVVIQASLAELRGDRQAILIGSSDCVRVQALLAAHPAVRSAAKTEDGIRVTLRPGYRLSVEEAAADINRWLLEAGVAVHRLEPARTSLEERFLEITSRLGMAA